MNDKKREPVEIKSRSVLTRTPEQQQEFDRCVGVQLAEEMMGQVFPVFLAAEQPHMRQAVITGARYNEKTDKIKWDWKFQSDPRGPQILRRGDGSERVIP